MGIFASFTSIKGRVPKTAAPSAIPSATQEPFWVRTTLIIITLLFLTLFLVVPLVSIFVEAFKKGWEAYIAAIIEPDAVSAIKLTLLTAAIAVKKWLEETGTPG
ncbi:MAG: hypothetical protein NWQ13_08770, partial [Glaciimonas sp.]|nr:hypothetical protein [Glaciimonas sp.]